MKEATPDIELSTVPLERDSQPTTEAKQTPLRRRHPLYLALLSPCFYPTPASRFWRRCPPLLIQTLRLVSFVIMTTVTIFLLFQLIIETGRTSESYSVKAARALAVIIVLHMIFHVLLVLYFSAYCYHGRAHLEGGLFGLEGQNSPEIAARYIREDISRDVISATCTPSKKLFDEQLDLKYDDLNRTTQNDISRAMKSFSLCLLNSEEEIISFYSLSDCSFRLSVYLFTNYIPLIALFHCTSLGESWVVAFWSSSAMSCLWFFGFGVQYWIYRLAYTELVFCVRRKFIGENVEKGPGDQSSLDWWRIELSKKPFEEIEHPKKAEDIKSKYRLRHF
jgi:hypothetical protein